MGMMAAMAAGAVIGGASSYFGGKEREDAAEQAMRARVKSHKKNIDFQTMLFGEQKDLAQPFYDIGLGAAQEQSNRFMAGEYDSPIWDFQFEEDPGYQFRKEEGTKAIQNQFAARGGLLSGAQRKAGARFAGDLASNEYGAAYAREQDDYARQVQARDRSFGQINTIAGRGAPAMSEINRASQLMGGRVGSSILGIGEARAGGAIDTGNARAGMYEGMAQSANQGLQNYMLYDYMK